MASTIVGTESSISGKCSLALPPPLGLRSRRCRLTCLTTSITLMDLIFPKIRRGEFLLKWKRAIESSCMMCV